MEAFQSTRSVLDAVERMKQARRSCRNVTILHTQRIIDSILPTSIGRKNRIRQLHYKILDQERLDEIELERKKNDLCRILTINNREGGFRATHVDNKIKTLQLRINKLHLSNYQDVSRLFERIVEQEQRLTKDRDFKYNNTSSNKDNNPKPNPTYMEVYRKFYNDKEDKQGAYLC